MRGERLELVSEARFKPLRSLVHVLAGLGAAALLALFPKREALLVQSFVLTSSLAFELIRLKSPRVNGWFMSKFSALLKPEEERGIGGHVHLFLGALAASLLFEREVAVAAILFLAAGDAAGVSAGSKLGLLRLGNGKSVEGAFACLASCLFVGSVYLAYFHALSFKTILVGSIAASIAELLSIPPDDNLSMPILAALAMKLVREVGR